MGILDFILNLVGLLLWLSWRAVPMSSLPVAPGAPLLRTLRPAQPDSSWRWRYLVGLAVLVLLRAIIYRQIGAAMSWTPQLRLVVVTLPFRSDLLGRMLLFSVSSFLLTLGIFYLSLMVLSMANRHVPDSDPVQRLVRIHLGWLERLPVWLKFVVMLLVPALLWLALSPLFIQLGMLPPVKSWGHTAQQAAVLALSVLPAWKYIIIAVLAVHLVNNYVYLGNAPLWNFANATARNLLAPLHWIPLRLGKLDLAPVLAIGVVYAIARLATDGLFGMPAWLPALYQKLPF